MFKKYTKYIKLIALLALVILAVRGLFAGNKIKTAQVKKVEIEKRIITKTVSASGSVVSKNEADLSFPATQRINSLKVKKGDFVKKGSFLAELDKQSVLNTVQASKDTRDIALRQRELFVKNEEDNKATLGGEDAYAIKLREYNESVSNAEAAYQAQLSNLDNYSMYAPFDGTVIDIYVKAGETAIAGTKVIKIADIKDLEFEISIDQEDYGQLLVGLPAEISLDAFDNVKFKGVITEIPTYADGADDSNFVAKISIENQDNSKPLLGMTGDVKITVATSSAEVNSLFYDQINYDESENPFVWVIDGEYITKFPVETGIEGDIYTEIKTEITKTLIVPINSDIEIKSGYKAKLIK